MIAASGRQTRLSAHVANLLQCRRCPRMFPPPVSGGAIISRVLLIGQAPGLKEPVLGRPFAWTAGRTLFDWFDEACGLNEAQMRSSIYFAAVCRCFPGKTAAGGDRVPNPEEIRNCSSWMNDEMEILRPRLVIPAGKLAIGQFLSFDRLDEVVGKNFPMRRGRYAYDLIPLPHPSGASPWHRIPPGKALLRQAMRLIARHPAFAETVRKAKVDRVSSDRPQVPSRADIPEQDKWDLAHLFAVAGKWNEDFAFVQRTYPEILRWKGRVGESSQTLCECLEFEKSLDQKIERLYHYASLQLAEDSANPDYLARMAQLQNLLTKISEAAAFVGPEIQAIDDETFARYLLDPRLASWRTKLRKIRRMKPHVLSEPEERLLALGAAALDGYDDTFSQLTNVDMKFGALFDEKGRERPLTQSSFSSFLVKRDHTLRRRAFHQFYEEFQDHQYTLASVLAYSVKADVFRARARKYSSALEASLFRDDVPVAVYDGLITAVRGNLAPLFRYYELRRRVLGLDELHHYDTYVPLVPEIETSVSFDEAVDHVLAALQPLGADYVGALGAGLRGRWCDRYENKNKRSGAFSSGSYGAPPYILMNYKSDVFSDVYTLAHETGHSMHTLLAQSAQTFQDYDYPIFLAEVASTFNEELLTHHLLEQTQDSKMRAYLINRQVDDIRGTLFRQTMFAEFEKITHTVEERGDALTLDVFKAEYRSLLEVYFAENFVIDPQLNLECLRIPHFYSAFYVYKYATGISAAIALAERVLSEERGSVEAYLGFLKSGGSKFPLETLKGAGVDMTTPAPVESTLRLFERRLEELEKLL